MDRSLCIRCTVNKCAERYHFCLSCLERSRRKPLDNLSDLDFGWLVGIIEGEGCFTFVRCKSIEEYLHPCIKVSSTDLDTITKVHNLINKGLISGPYRKDEARHKLLWRWSISGTKAAVLMGAFKPYMGIRRQERITEVLLIAEKERERGRIANAEAARETMKRRHNQKKIRELGKLLDQ